ncbi:MAG: tRNA lysidine(34) synthetase TilS [Calditrichia bacterium]
MKQSLKHAFLRFLKQHSLVQKNQRLLLAISGGLDSMVLLALFQEWQRMLQLDLHILHVNHQLRGAESDADEAFVAQIAKDSNLSFHSLKRDVQKLADEQRLSLEEAGRQARLEFFTERHHALNADAVATAHHLDDQAETVLMHLFSGTGLDGLAGIRLKRDILIRPLLFASRDAISTFAKQNDLRWREDESNKNLRFVRNRIRQLIIPYIQQHAGNFSREALLRSGLTLQEWLDATDSVLEEAKEKLVFDGIENKIRLEMGSYREYFSRNRLRLLEYCVNLIAERPHQLSYNTFESFTSWLDNPTGRRFWLTKQISAMVRSGDLIIAGPVLQQELHEELLPDKRYEFLPPGIAVEVWKESRSTTALPDGKLLERLDGEHISFPLILRTWKADDRFQPLGLAFEKKIKDFLSEGNKRFLPKEKSLVLLNGVDIIAVLGERISERYKVTNKTTQIINVRTERL